MTTKKTKKVTFRGVTKNIEFYKGKFWINSLTPDMKKFVRETGKNPIRSGHITGTYEYWLYWRPKKKQQRKSKSRIKSKYQTGTDIDLVAQKWLNQHMRGYSQKDKDNVYEETMTHTVQELRHWEKFYEQEAEKRHQKIQSKKGKDLTSLDFIKSSSAHDLRSRYLNALMLKQTINRYKKNKRTTNAWKFIKKKGNEPDSYGYDLEPLYTKIENITGKQREKDTWQDTLDILRHTDNTINNNLSYINYRRDIIQNIKEGRTKANISDIPIHPWADIGRKENLSMVDEIEKEMKEKEYKLSKQEKQEIKNIIRKYYT